MLLNNKSAIRAILLILLLKHFSLKKKIDLKIIEAYKEDNKEDNNNHNA